MQNHQKWETKTAGYRYQAVPCLYIQLPAGTQKSIYKKRVEISWCRRHMYTFNLGKVSKPLYRIRSFWSFVENCPYFCNIARVFWHSERYWAIWHTGQQCSERALNLKKTTNSQKPEFRMSFYINELSEELGTLISRSRQGSVPKPGNEKNQTLFWSCSYP